MILFPDFLDCSILPPAIVLIILSFFIFFLPPGVFSLQNLYNSVVFMSVIKNLIEHSLMTPSCSISSHGVLEDLHIILMKCCSSFLTFEIFGLIVNLLWEFCMWFSTPLIVYVPCLYLFQMLPYVVCSFIFCGMFWRTDVCNFDDVWCRLLIL